MAKPTPMTSVQDSCQCGSELRIASPDARYVVDQHDEWLEQHEPCQQWHDHWWEQLAKRARAAITGDES